MDAQDPSRGRTVQVGEWWRTVAKAKILALGLKQLDLAEELDVSEATLSRDLGTNVNVENVQRLARRLDLPPPVIIPESELEARAIDDLLKSHRHGRDAALQAIDAGVRTIASVGSKRTHGEESEPPGLGKRRRPSR